MDLQEEDTDIAIKVIIVGNGRVGKTSLMNRYCSGTMTNVYKKTLGTDFMEKDISLDNYDDIKLMLWDTAGQEMFSKLTKNYYRGAQAVIYVFSTDDRESFIEIERWQEKVENECNDHIISILVQNKIDLLDQAKMTNDEVENLSRKLNIKLYRTCVKDNINVNEIFINIATNYINNLKVHETHQTTPMGFNDNDSDDDNSDQEQQRRQFKLKAETKEERIKKKKNLKFCTIL